MTIKEAVVLRLNEISIKNNLSFHSIALKAGLSPSTLKNILNGRSRNPGIVTIKIICDGINMSIKDFFNSDIFDDLEQEIK